VNIYHSYHKFKTGVPLFWNTLYVHLLNIRDPQRQLAYARTNREVAEMKCPKLWN